MTPERWAQIEELFHRAAESDPQYRTAMLELACGSDSELRQQVETLLSSDKSARSQMQAAVRSEFDAVAFSLTGKTVSHYRILDGLDGGGMGVVYRAEDTRLGRQVAIKFLPEESARNPVALERFEREARAASALEHPNICPVYEFGEHEGQPFLVMQLLGGQTLREMIASADPGTMPFELTKLLDIAIQISDGLNAAHGHGIIHRDIKPANIFVTRQGQVKILDFGIAKLANADAEPGDGEAKTTDLPADRFLSRTGMAIGTAAYMSPEQIRGEKLDARTDLFSFGLVLYEMAAGKSTLTAETGSLLQLNQIPVRALNSDLPAKLEKIVQRSLEGDREARYQSALQMRADLEAVKVDPKPRSPRWWAMGAGVVVLLVAIVSLWFARRQPQPIPSTPDLKLRQLTSNSAENHVLAGRISPDGKYLAYVDLKGIHIKVIETDETQDVSQPDALKDQKVQWEFGAWSPDSSRFLLNSYRAGIDPALLPDKDLNIWQFPVQGGRPRMLRSMAWADSFSPDGSLISFREKAGRSGHPEIWLMDVNGEHTRKLIESGDESVIDMFLWSPDGKRVSYIRHNESKFKVLSRDLKGSRLTDITPPFDMRNVYDGLELPDGRSIFSVKEIGTIGGETCNFWSVRVDPRTGKPIERPRQLTHWTGFCMTSISVSRDGKRLAFVEWSGHPTLYVADLQAGATRMANERHLTLSESSDIWADWTPDSKSIVYWSNRNGHDSIYKQRLDEDTPKLLVTSQDRLEVGCVSPDGKWFIFLVKPELRDSPKPPQLMRVPLAGGASHTIFTVNNLHGWECAKRPSALCLVAERSDDRKQVILSAFDPLAGRGSEVTKIALDPKVESWAWALSPNATRLALIRSPGNPLQILSLKGKVLQEIKIPEWSNSGPVKWAADGQGLFVPSINQGEATLLYVNLRGEVHVLRKNRAGEYSTGVPSPDGRHVAVVGTADNRNVWMMENF